MEVGEKLREFITAHHLKQNLKKMRIKSADVLFNRLQNFSENKYFYTQFKMKTE